MKMLIPCLAGGAGGFLGALCRFGVASLSTRLFGRGFPVGTLIVNVTGSFALGYILSRAARGWSISEGAQLAVTVGFLGAYTTYSTFMFETDTLLRTGSAARAILYVLASLVLGLLAVRLGFIVGGRG